jgi:predicted component of type VI protein secretion system
MKVASKLGQGAKNLSLPPFTTAHQDSADCDILGTMANRPSNPAQPNAAAPATAELEVEQFGNFPITRVTTIGRAPESNIVLNARSVSRHHARIFYEGNHFWIKDLESANGTRVNGKKITLQMLSDADKIIFGEVKSVFHHAAQVPGPAPIARDPMAGFDDFFADGTPTGGLKGHGRDTQPIRAAEVPTPQPAATPWAPEPVAAPWPPEPAVKAWAPEAAAKPWASEPAAAPWDSAPVASREAELLQRIQTLESENAMLRSELQHSRGTAGSATSGTGATQRLVPEDSSAETERLRRLVNQLERALADANLRIRNLQDRLK